MSIKKNGKLRVVLAGCGGITGAWFTPALERGDIEFVGLVDIDLERARAKQREHALDKAVVGTDLGEVLRQTSPDAVFDCTIPAAHRDVTLAALKHGCHVLGEKPLADSMAAAREVVRAAAGSGKLYAVMQNRRYLPEARRMRDLVASGVLGRITTLNADFYLDPHFGGFREEMEHVLLLDMAIHTFDTARFITGEDPVSVSCHEWNPRGSWFRHGSSAVAVFELSGGTVFCYRGSWCAVGLSTAWESEWRAIGERGSAKWDGGITMTAQILKEGGAQGFQHEKLDLEVPPPPELEHRGHGGAMDDFIRCWREGGTPQTVCSDNIKSLAMVHAAIESAGSGNRIPVRW